MSSAGLVSICPFQEEMLFSPPPVTEHSQELIMIYVAMSGSMVPMRVMESDSIESVKLRIQNCKGIFTRNQKLVCGGRELSRSNSLMRDYGVSNGNIVHLVLRLSDLQVINVTTSCGKEFTFHVERSRDVGYVKRQIAKNRTLDRAEDHEVLLNGEPVEDQRLITDISKSNTDAVIHLFVRKSAKIRASPVGKNLELSITAPRNVVRKHNSEKGRRYEGDSDNLNVTRKPPIKETLLEPVIVNPKIELPPIKETLLEPFEDCTFEWLYWPQARQSFSAETIDYIKSMNAEEDIALLKFYGWDIPLECTRILRISTMLLQKGVEKGIITPFAIGNLMCRETLRKESVIERIVQEAESSILPGTSEAKFLECVSYIMDSYLEGLV